MKIIKRFDPYIFIGADDVHYNTIPWPVRIIHKEKRTIEKNIRTKESELKNLKIQIEDAEKELRQWRKAKIEIRKALAKLGYMDQGDAEHQTAVMEEDKINRVW